MDAELYCGFLLRKILLSDLVFHTNSFDSFVSIVSQPFIVISFPIESLKEICK